MFFFRSTNAIFGKIGRLTSEEVTLQLVRMCIQNVLYGLECFSVAKADIKSLDFALTPFLMKLFKATNIDVVERTQTIDN